MCVPLENWSFGIISLIPKLQFSTGQVPYEQEAKTSPAVCINNMNDAWPVTLICSKFRDRIFFSWPHTTRPRDHQLTFVRFRRWRHKRLAHTMVLTLILRGLHITQEWLRLYIMQQWPRLHITQEWLRLYITQQWLRLFIIQQWLRLYITQQWLRQYTT